VADNTSFNYIYKRSGNHELPLSGFLSGAGV